MNEDAPTVTEFVEYCQLQAGLLSGRVETMGEEAAALLDEVDAELAATRERLDEQRGTAGTESPPAPDPERDTGSEDDAMAALEADLGEKQALVEAKQARMAAFQSLAAGYTDLAAELDSVESPSVALDRVVEFEREHHAPTYFDERETMLETVARE